MLTSTDAHLDDPYTMESALGEAAELLKSEFGHVDQSAAVSLATFLYGAHARDEFLRGHVFDATPYGC